MNKQIVRLAIPNILSNLSVPLLGLVDTAITGHLGQAYYLGALAIGGMIFNFIFWGFGFLRMGTTGLTAQAYGSENPNEQRHIFFRGATVAIIGSVALLIFHPLFADIAFYLTKTTPETEFFAREYYNIRIFAAPATLMLYVFNGWFLGMQNALYPMIVTVVQNLANIAFNALFVFKLGMKVEGVAYGTICANYLALFVAISLVNLKYDKLLWKKLEIGWFNREKITEFFNLNKDIFLRTMSLVFTFTFFTAQSASWGDQLLAANTILMQLLMVFSFGIDGFAYAAESLAGAEKGRRSLDGVKNVVKYSMIWGIALGAVGSLVYFIFDDFIIRIFTSNPHVIREAHKLYYWIILAPLVGSVCYIWDGIYIGYTASKPMRNNMLISAFLVFLPCFYTFKWLIGIHALWLAMILFFVSRGVGLTLYSKKHIFVLPPMPQTETETTAES